LNYPVPTPIFHITDIGNLRGIIDAGALRSDIGMAERNPERIGYDHIKQRRATEIRVACCGDRFVGEFVPFYFCPRSPMLFTINRGNTGRPAGCQRTIVHLVSSVEKALESARDWAISDGNAGAYHSLFYKDTTELKNLDWEAIRATIWQGMTHQKMAEFLVADSFPWASIKETGCFDSCIANEVSDILKDKGSPINPDISIRREWYY